MQTSADYYGADIFKAKFDNQTLKEINYWIKDKTDDLIDKVLDDISPEAVMYLINTILFDAGWEQIYNKNYIHNSTFKAYDQSKLQI